VLREPTWADAAHGARNVEVQLLDIEFRRRRGGSPGYAPTDRVGHRSALEEG
jgi:hypothetical protein